MQRGLPLSDLALEDFQQLDPQLDGSVFDVLGVKNALSAFASYGSTAPAEVAKRPVISDNVVLGNRHLRLKCALRNPQTPSLKETQLL